MSIEYVSLGTNYSDFFTLEIDYNGNFHPLFVRVRSFLSKWKRESMVTHLSPAHSLWSRILEGGVRVSSHPGARADALYAGDSLPLPGAGADRHGGVAQAGGQRGGQHGRPSCVGARRIVRAGVHG